MLRSQYSSKIALATIFVVGAMSLVISTPFDRQKAVAYSTCEETRSADTSATEEDDPIVPPQASMN